MYRILDITNGVYLTERWYSHSGLETFSLEYSTYDEACYFLHQMIKDGGSGYYVLANRVIDEFEIVEGYYDDNRTI